MDEVERLGLLTKAVTREVDRRLSEGLKPLGITPSQAEVLQVLARYGPLSLGELGRLVLSEGGHPSRLVDRLVASQLVTRVETPGDRRRVELRCTEEGARLATEAACVKERFREWLRGQLGDVSLEPAFRALAAVLAGTDVEETVSARAARPLVPSGGAT